MKTMLLSTPKRKVIAFIALCMVVLLIGAAVFVLRDTPPEAKAKQVISSLFTCTPQDEAALLTALVSSQSSALTDYITGRYPDLFTAKGYETVLSNRIFTRATAAATEAGADFTVTSVALSRRKSDADVWYFDYEMTAKAQLPSQDAVRARGGISMVQEDGQWKAQSVTIDDFSV